MENAASFCAVAYEGLLPAAHAKLQVEAMLSMNCADVGVKVFKNERPLQIVQDDDVEFERNAEKMCFSCKTQR